MGGFSGDGERELVIDGKKRVTIKKHVETLRMTNMFIIIVKIIFWLYTMSKPTQLYMCLQLYLNNVYKWYVRKIQTISVCKVLAIVLVKNIHWLKN